MLTVFEKFISSFLSFLRASRVDVDIAQFIHIELVLSLNRIVRVVGHGLPVKLYGILQIRELFGLLFQLLDVGRNVGLLDACTGREFEKSTTGVSVLGIRILGPAFWVTSNRPNK